MYDFKYLRLLKELKGLAGKILPLKNQIENFGGFAGDRELLSCENCGLVEDIKFGGEFITYFLNSNQKEDTGLRFKELSEKIFRCPHCNSEVYLLG